MAAVCDICGKGPGFGKSVSHSHRRTSRRWDPNIQTVRAVTRPGGNKKRVNVCTRASRPARSPRLSDPAPSRAGASRSARHPSSVSSSLARLNGRDPKNPRDADSGDGCADSIAAQSVAAASA